MQTLLVALAVIAAATYAIKRIRAAFKKGGAPCAGCPMHQACQSCPHKPQQK